MIKLQNINFPEDCKIIIHKFHDYDPENSFSEENNFDYLSEDLFQCEFPEESIIIDLGWYGDIMSSKGKFKIQIIQDENWEVPVNVIHSKSVGETATLLNKILDYYTAIEIEIESEVESI
jgi:hypothetical protein